jgi:hypothetical protein
VVEDPGGLAATEGIVEVEDQAGMVDIMVATEGIIEGMEDIVGIMVGMVDIMGEDISTEDPASTSADTLGTPTTIPTGIILLLITILINRMPLLSLPPTSNRSKTPIGITARLPRVLPLRYKLPGWVDEGGSDSSPIGKRKEVT